MTYLNTIIPFTSFIVSATFAAFIFRRFLIKHGNHLLFWGIGMTFYAIGGFSEAAYGAFGWNPLVFRLWYLFGAVLVAAWLGQGTAFLLIRRRIVYVLLAILIAGSIYAAFRVFTAQLDPGLMTSSLHTGSELSGQAIVTPGVRTLTPFFNLYGTLLLVGGAGYSAWLFFRKRVLLHRTVGNVLIAAGALLPAFGGTFSRMGIPGALYISELLGAIVMFIGFIRATTPIPEPARASQEAASAN